MSLKLSVAPAVEPITLQDARDFLRVDALEDDDLITSLIVAARDRAQTILRRALVTQTWVLKADHFPRYRGNGWWRFDGRNTTRDAIVLPLPPVQSVTSVQYLDSAGDTQTMDAEDYVLSLDDEPARITLPDRPGCWPVTKCVADAVTITFVAGYGDAADDVPEGIKTYLKMRVAQMYDNRGAEKDVSLDGLLDPYCWGSYV